MSVCMHVSYKAGNRSATFPAQLLGWDVDALNTVQFSNHTGYGRWGGHRFDAQQLNDILTGMDQNGLVRHDRLLTGYTPSPEALAVVEAFIISLRKQNPDVIYLLDPVMGDMDRGMYVNPDVLPIYRRMLSLSTIICPNQFEAQVLVGHEITTLSSLQHALHVLHYKYKVPNVVITSLELPESEMKKIGATPTMADGQPAMLLVGSSVQEDGSDASWLLQFPTLGEYFSGVGDLFASLILSRFSCRGTDVPGPARTSDEVAAAPREPAAGDECTLPVARAVMYAVASLQHVLQRTRETMIAEGQRQGIDPFQPAHLAEVDERVKIMRLRELRIVQSAQEILAPSILHRPRWTGPL